jgi:plastocyanin
LKKIFLLGFFVTTILFSISLIPESYAANANLFVSAENSQFDNYMSGPQVIEVVVIDSDINDTDEAKGEPDVTVNGKILRMVQAVDGNWYGYFADETMANIADGTTSSIGIGLDFGDVSDASTAGTAIAGSVTFFSDANAVAHPGTGEVNVVREAKDANTQQPGGFGNFTSGQIGIDEALWPFIQLYPLNPTGNVVVQYNKGGGAQTTTLTFDTVDQFAGAELDKASYGQGDEVHLTITDLWLNIDPTDEDSWTFGTTGVGNTIAATTYYQVFDENGQQVGDTPQNTDQTLTDSLSNLMCEDNCRLLTTSDVQGKGFVITLQDNDDSVLTNADGDPGNIDSQNPFDWQTGSGNLLGSVPVTITEQGPNSGVFGTYDESDQSNIIITDNALRGTSASVDYNETPATILVGFSFGNIDIQPVDDEWSSGEEIPVILVDGDANRNSRADEDLDLFNPNVMLIPSLQTGSPTTLSGLESAFLGKENVCSSCEIQQFSDRALLQATSVTFAIVNGDVLSIDFGNQDSFYAAAPINTNPDTIAALLNYDIRSVGRLTGASSVGISIADVPIATNADLQGLILLNNSLFTDDFDLVANFTLNGADSIVSSNDVMPVVIDIFGFGFTDDGVETSERVANQIVRLELEETGDNTSTFEGSLEYTMVNQLNILDPDTYVGLMPIADDPKFIAIEDLTDEDAPRVNYLDLGADGVSTQVSDQEEAPNHSGIVSFDQDSYKVGSTVTVTVNDQDLNVDSDLIDIFTVVDGTLFSDPARDTVGKPGLPEYGFGPLGKLLEITIDDVRWQESENCTTKDGAASGLFSSGFALVETNPSSGILIGDFVIPTNWCRDGATEPEGTHGLDLEVDYVDFRDASGEIIEVGDSAGIRATTGSVSLDKSVYLIPLKVEDYGDTNVAIKVNDADFDITSNEDFIAENTSELPVGPVKISVIRDNETLILGYAGGPSPVDGVINVGSVLIENSTVRQFGPMRETSNNSGIFEINISIKHTDGPSNSLCPETIIFEPTDGTSGTSELNRFSTSSPENENYCVLEGDILQVEYTDPIDASGDLNTVTDSGIFDVATNPDPNVVFIEFGTSGNGCQIDDSCLTPSSISIFEGEKITWYNFDIAVHTITSGSPENGPDGIFDSGFIFPNHSFSFVFETPGNFAYYDIIHPWIIGNIVVEEIVIPPEADVVIEKNSHNVNCSDSDSCYIPSSLTVEPGSEVMWFNADLETHLITSGTQNNTDGKFSVTLDTAQNFTYTFNQIGTFPYFDIVHPWAIGEIIVMPTFPPGIDILIPEGSSSQGCELTDVCFIPSNFIANSGDTITWLNDDSAGHSVTSGTPGGGPDGKFDSGLLFPGEEFSNQFFEEGVYPYYDLLHPWMVGNITINPGNCEPTLNGDWMVESSCVLSSNTTIYGNVIVQNGVVLEIPSGVTLDIDFANHNLTVKSGGGVLIKNGGSIT